MNYEEITLKSRDGYSLSLHVFEAPVPKAVIKFIHGMEEHQGRYIPFAGYLQEHGYTVVTADLHSFLDKRTVSECAGVSFRPLHGDDHREKAS